VETFARPAIELPRPLIGGLEVSSAPSQGQGLALDDIGRIPSALRSTFAGYEYEYQEQPADVSITATTVGTAAVVVTADAVTFDGSTTVMIDFFCGRVDHPSGAANRGAHLTLYDALNGGAAAQVGADRWVDLGLSDAVETLRSPVVAWRRLTPASGSHVFSVRGWVTAGTATWRGTGDWPPMFIRITRAT
jgi:hypothetical protein